MDLRLLDDQPTLVGKLVRLEPLGQEHFEGLWPMFADEDRGAPLTVARFTREQVRQGMARARERHDRADWAIVDVEDGIVLGEAVLFELDEDNESMVFRIALVGPWVFGHGYGTEATALVRDFAFDQLGLHRLSLEVDEDNPRARRVYEKCGFLVEGVRRDVKRVDGVWHDAIDMALLDCDPRP